MTVVQWYRRATALPYIVPIIGGAIGQLMHFRPSPLVDLFVILGFAAIYQTIPYTIFLIVVWLAVKPRSVRALRRTALLAPIAIAIPFAVAATIFDSGRHPSLDDFFPGVALYGIPAVVVGYFYVMLVEIGALIVRLSSHQPPAAESADPTALEAR